MRPVSKETRQRLAQLAEELSDWDQLIWDAREWLLDCFGEDEETEDYIEAMSVLEVMLAVERFHAGGWSHFVELSC